MKKRNSLKGSHTCAVCRTTRWLILLYPGAMDWRKPMKMEHYLKTKLIFMKEHTSSSKSDSFAKGLLQLDEILFIDII